MAHGLSCSTTASPALEGTFLTTGPLGSPPVFNYFNLDFSLAFTFENDISRALDTSPRCLIWHFLTWPPTYLAMPGFRGAIVFYVLNKDCSLWRPGF